MSILLRYLGGGLVRSYFLIGATLSIIFALIAFLEEVEDVGDGNYTTLDAFLVVAFTMPARLIDLTPFVCLLGTLWALANFGRTSELIAMRATGLSTLRLAAVCALLSLGYLVPIAVSELAARPLYQHAMLARDAATNATGNPLPGRGFWTRNATTYVNVAASAGRPAGTPLPMHVINFDEAGEMTQYLAARNVNTTREMWRLEDVKEVKPQPQSMLTEHHDEVSWAPVWSSEMHVFDLPAVSLTLAELADRVRDNGDAGRDDPSVELEFWRRIWLPLSGLAFVLLATPFALAPNPRGGVAGQLSLGVLMALGIYLAEQVVVNASILTGLPVPLAVAIPPLAVLSGSLLVLRRTS